MSDTPLTIPLSSIDLEQRRDFGDLSGLKDSLKRLGTIHPPVLSRYTHTDGTIRYQPVAGRRRLCCLKELGHTLLFHNSHLDPERPGFAFKEEVPEDELREAELDENLFRLKPKWQEDCLLVADIHELKRKKLGPNKWGIRHTAALLGEGYGRNNVSLAINAAKLLRAKDPEIMACANLMEATTIRIKRQEDKALALLQQRVAANLPKVESKGTGSFLESFNIPSGNEQHGPGASDLKGPHKDDALTQVLAAVPITVQNAPVAPKPPVQVPLSQMFWNTDFRKRLNPNLPDIQFNHIVTDIPYGIDMANLNSSSKLDDVKAEHEVEANISMMPDFLQTAYAFTKPHGFCVFFYDLDHHEKLQSWAKGAGWKVQPWPLIWHKLHACQNNAAQYNTTKNFEVAMILRKDSHTVLRDPKLCQTSIISCDGAAERRLYNNPFAKPFELWKWIFDMIAFPGQTVLDPFCGEMSSCRAAANCGLIPYGIEINEKHYNRGLENMKKVYAVIHSSNVEFV